MSATARRTGGWLIAMVVLTCMAVLGLHVSRANDALTAEFLPHALQQVLQNNVPPVTLLPGGRLLTLQSSALVLTTPSSARGAPATRTVLLPQTRRFASLTVFPDGRVLIWGGVDAEGRIVGGGLWFDSSTGELLPAADVPMVSRAGQTATVLTDGRLLITGGWSAQLGLMPEAVIWDPRSGASKVITSLLEPPRIGQVAMLLADGRVQLMSGVDQNGTPVTTTTVFDSTTEQFQAVGAKTLMTPVNATSTPKINGAIPAANARGFPADGMLSVRFSEPMDPRTINAKSITLLGPGGNIPVRVVGVEGGRLAFITPSSDLYPGAHYTLFVQGVLSPWHIGLPFTAIDFTVAAAGTNLISTGSDEKVDPTLAGEATVDGSKGPASAAASAMSPLYAVTGSTSTSPKANDPCGTTGHPANTLCRQSSFVDTTQDAWYPGQDNAGGPHSGGWRINKPDITPEEIAYAELMLRVPEGTGTTGVTARIELVDGKPIGNVDVSIGNHHVRTDPNGWFELTGVPAGHHWLYIDGTTADSSGHQYGQFVVGVNLRQGVVLPLPYRMYLPRILSRDVVDIPSPTTREMVITQPDIPGLEIHIPKGTVIKDYKGKVVTRLAIVPTPVDRAPFPTANNFPVFFSIQPSGATVQNIYSNEVQGISLVYPNYGGIAPGTLTDFVVYHPDTGWKIYGHGHITSDGLRVLPDANSGRMVWLFSGMFALPGTRPPDQPQGKENGPCCADPVDLFSGTLEEVHTDISIRDIMPLTLARYFHGMAPASTSWGSPNMFGNWRSNYDMYLYDAGGGVVDLILPDGNAIPFNSIATRPGEYDTYQAAISPTRWSGALMEAMHGSPDFVPCALASTDDYDCVIITLKNGVQYIFSDGIGGNNLLKFIRDRFGNQTALTWNAGLLQQITSPSGRFISLTYNGDNTIATATDNTGRMWSYNYQAESVAWTVPPVTIDFLKSVAYPDSTSWSYTYETTPTADDAGALLTLTDRDGNPTTNQYSGEKVTQQILADGKTWVFSYGTNSATVTDANGNVHDVVFDPASGYPSSVTNAAGTSLAETTTYVRDSNGLIHSMTDSLERTTKYTYDDNGNVLSVTRLAGTLGAVTENFTWTPDFNQIATYQDGLGHSTSFTYSDGCLSQIEDPLGHIVKTACSATGQPLSVTDPLGDETTFDYQGYDLRSVTDALGHTTTFTVDVLGRLIAVADPLGDLSRRIYDNNGRVASMIDPMNNTTGIGYDGMGNVTAVTLPNTGTIGYFYDERNRLKKRTDALSHSEYWTYNGMGEVLTHTDRNGQTTTNSYDALGRRFQMAYADGSAITVNYDAGNRVRRLDDSANGILRFDWDGLDRLKQAISSQGTINYTYDKANRRTSMTASSQATVTYIYDTADRPIRFVQGSETVRLTYDDANRRKTLTLPNGVKLSYSYNNTNGVTAITYKQASGTSLGNLFYTYDEAGRRESEIGTLSSNTLPTATTQDGTFDFNNRQTGYDGTTLQYDANGNLIFDGTNTYVWNARNELVQIKQGAALIDSFSYDALGRRQSKSINGDPPISFLYDGLNPVQEAQGGTVIPILTGSGVDEYFARTEPSGRAYFLTDALGSTIGLTDTGGNLIQQYQYGPYGEANANNPGITNPYQYTGRENDGDGLYYYRARYYSSSMKRFIREDPAEMWSGWNEYSYVEGDPISSTDPLGLMTTMTCRHLGGWQSYAMPGARHCSDFAWHWETDPCTGEQHKVVDAQFSLAGGDSRPNVHPSDQTHKDDLAAFNNPGGFNSNYDISPPDGMSQNTFDQFVIQNGNAYSQGPYNMLGPNSNTAATQIILRSGGTDPGAWGAVGDNADPGH